MLTLLSRGFAAAVVVAALAAPVSAPQAQNVAAIEQRKAAFKQTGDAMKAIKAILEAKGPVAGALAPAQTIVASLDKVGPLFGPDTKTGAETKALPDIWNNTQAFTTAYTQSKAAAEALVLAAKGTDLAALGMAFQATGKSCGTCHDGFRAK